MSIWQIAVSFQMLALKFYSCLIYRGLWNKQFVVQHWSVEASGMALYHIILRRLKLQKKWTISISHSFFFNLNLE